MQISLSEILSSEGKIVQTEVLYEPDIYQTGVGAYPILDKKPVQFEFENLGEKKIYMKAVIELTLSMPCDRCLEDVRKEFHIVTERELDMNETEAQRIEALDEMNFISGSNLDVDSFVYGEILLNLPMKILCRDDCKGICSRCGINLNRGTCDCDTKSLDPRMAKILDVFNNSNK